MSLMEHLVELRSRLWKAIASVAVLGGLSLFFAKDLFGLLMKPVLAALPEGSQSLIYTSGIEEINVLLQVGLYAGIFLASPVILFQIWRFVAPGLYQHERRLVAPFVLGGTGFFLGGAIFCYFVILPTMFQFLLTEGDEHQVRDRAMVARAADIDASRLMVLGDDEGAKKLIESARHILLEKGDGQVEELGSGTPTLEELKAWDASLSLRLDAAVAVASSASASAEGRADVQKAIRARDEAALAISSERIPDAARRLADGAAALSAAHLALQGPAAKEAFDDLWRLDQHLGVAVHREASQEWTRPMLTMREQLSLVLLLEIAFGIIFELPLIMALLSWLGLVKASFLAKYQRHAILLCVILAAVITPTGDAVNLSLMAVPMIVCYELGVLAAWLIEKKRGDRKPQLKVVS
jgi:sec-independent protein translocase protein TatC